MRIDSALLRSRLAPDRGLPDWKWGAARGPCRATGIADLDAVLGGGFALGRLHEVYAASAEDAASAAGFVAALAIGVAKGEGTILWLRSRRGAEAGGVMQGAGLAELGGAPETCVFVLAADAAGLLRAGIDAVRCSGGGGKALAAIIIEGWGAMRALDLTASRRLALAAEKSAALLLLLRVDAEPAPSAAETRWLVAAAPSRALAGEAPGAPSFEINLLRQRAGPCGLGWQLEWDRDRCSFHDTAPHSGAVVPLSERRAAADSGAGALRRSA